ncbi:MAG: hypothetical protein AAB267_00840, partial [Candidatus Desantisbacteria bacterium]
LCISLGDCGGYINFNGDYTNDGYTSGAGRIKGEQYKACAEYQPGQKPAEPGDFSFSQILGIPEGVGEGEVPQPSSMMGMLGLGIGAVNMIGGMTSALSTMPVIGKIGVEIGSRIVPGLSELLSATKEAVIIGQGEIEFGNQLIAEGKNLIATGVPEQVAVGKELVAGGESMVAQGGGDVVGGTQVGKEAATEAFGNALAVAGAVLSVASFMQAGFGMSAGASYAIGGVVAGAMVLLHLTAYLGPVGIVLMLASWIMGLGKTKIIWHANYPKLCPHCRHPDAKR